MNVLFITMPAVVPNKGGIGRVTGILAEELEKKGVRCRYLALLRENEDGADAGRQFYLPFPREKNFSSPENQRFYERLLSEQKIDVVIFQCSFKKFPFKKFKGHPPLIFVLHNDPCEYSAHIADKAAARLLCVPARTRRLITPLFSHVLTPIKICLRRMKMRRLHQWNFGLADRFVLLSKSYVKGFVAHLAGTPDVSKLTAVYNPCSYTPPPLAGCSESFPQKEKILLFVGRLNFIQKRPDIFLKIWARLQTDFPDWRAEILGDGRDTEALKVLAGKLNLDRVRFRGFADPKKFYQSAPILCMTSSTEGFPMVMCEASSQGCVPVAFDSFAPAQEIIVSGENGFLIKPFDLDAYAGTLRALMSDPARLDALSKNAVGNARRFSAGRIADEWLSLFDELLEK